MHATEQPLYVEAFLLIEQPRQRLGHWTKALAALDGPTAPPLAAVIGYYDPTSDQALLDLQYELAHANMKFVVDVALLAEVGVVQPAELSEGERVRFLAERLPRCSIRVTAQRTAVGALGELVRRIKELRANHKISTQPPPVPPPAIAMARSVQPRGDTQDPIMLVTAKGTRDNLERVAEGQAPSAALLGSGPEPPPPPRRDDTPPARRETTVADAPQSEARARQRLGRAERHRHPTVPMPFELTQRLIGESSQLVDLRTLPKPPPPPAPRRPPETKQLQPRDKTPAPPPARVPSSSPSPQLRERTPLPAPHVGMPALSRATVEAPTREKTPQPRARVQAQTEPYLPTAPSGPELPNVIYARYLRGGRWVAVRVGALSLKGAVLLTGALPRVDDRIEIALTFGTHRAIVRGVVGKVSTAREATATGVSTFSVAFELDDAARRSLTALLLAAREAKITIKPPPPRANRRFPVEWQVALGTPRGAVKATALDVSTQGMFVQPTTILELDATLAFSIVLDDGSSPIAGRARVVRQIKEHEARACGLAPGFGLMIVNMSEADRMRWLGFLARIERRAEKRVLIGAEPARLAELQAGLASLGYAVSGGTDPSALVELATADGRPADAVLIDAGWLKNEASAQLVESTFTARNVPCVTLQGEPRRARQAIDRLLEVVV